METFCKLPVGVQPLESQGGGHKFGAKNGMIGIMTDTDGSVLKPLCSEPGTDVNTDLEELHFYQRVSNSCQPADKALRQLIPGFYGTRHVCVADQDVECIKLENLTLGLRRVCVMDVKIGRITTVPSASESKRSHEASKYLGTRKPFGFSVPGVTYYDLVAGKTVKHDKVFGKQLDATNIVEAFCQFFNANYCAHCAGNVVGHLIDDLSEIACWFRNQHQYRFFASSVLLIYDAATYESCSLRNIDQSSHSINENGDRLVCIPRSDQSQLFSSQSGNQSSRLITDCDQQLAGLLCSDQSDIISEQSDKCDNQSADYNDNSVGVANYKIHVRARMVDFAHVETISGCNLVDENYLEGLLGLINLLDNIRKQ